MSRLRYDELNLALMEALVAGQVLQGDDMARHAREFAEEVEELQRRIDREVAAMRIWVERGIAADRAHVDQVIASISLQRAGRPIIMEPGIKIVGEARLKKKEAPRVKGRSWFDKAKDLWRMWRRKPAESPPIPLDPLEQAAKDLLDELRRK